MPEMQVAREALSHLLVDIRDIDESVVRGEKRLGSQTYAVAYVDLADNVVARAQNLREFQERILGDDFFDATGDLRWNKYLYIVAGPNSTADPAAFSTAKAIIEADKDYARKRVVSKDELESLLGGARLFVTTTASQAANVLAEWERRLSSSELDLLLDCPTPRTTVVERVAQGTAKRADSQERAKTLNAVDAHLATSKLTELTIEQFREGHNGKTYRFGQVTLVIGPNGSGKTSLLEAVEFLYCGHNRRDNSASSRRLTAKFTKHETGEEYPLTSTVESARIKERCLAWYNRDERNAKAIVDGFTRYNFLDTDAAFRISTDLEPSEVATDLSRLLIGPSAAVIWDYLTKITADIDRAWEKVQADVDRQKLALEAKEKALKEMQDKPSVAKALAHSYRQSLGALGWLQISNSSKLEPSEGELILAALGHLQALQSAGDSARTIRAIQARRSELDEAISQSAPHSSELTELHSKEQTLGDAIKTYQSTIGAINRWIIYVSSGFQRLRVSTPKTTQEAQEATKRLGKFAVGPIPEVPSAYQFASLEVATHIAGEALTQARDRVRELQILADTHGKAAAARATLANRLKEAALAAIAQTDNMNKCPVCKTTHPSGELSRLIMTLNEGTADNPELQKISEALQSAQTQAQTAHDNLDTIKFVDTVAGVLGLGADLPAHDILRQLLRLREKSDDLNEQSRSATRDLRELAEKGFSSDEYDLIWGQIRSLFADTDSLTIEAATAMRVGLLGDIDSKQHELSEIQSVMKVRASEIQRICQRVTNSQWSTSVPVNNTHDTLAALREEFKIVLARIPQLRAQIVIGDDTPLFELQARIASTFVAFKEAFLAAQSESESSEELVDLARQVADGKLKLRNSEGELKALGKAVAVLGALLAESSLEKASQDSLAAIGGQINEVFSRIHAPREYEYVGKQDVLLQTAVTHEARTLEQVSTGQRAAFALSIFLALNRTATSAPPVLLIDDPIAHIDDLNALSFLDYLRDLAVNSGRQIFFATADTRIASLFSKKFSFLGEEAFKTIPLGRAEVTPPASVS